MATEIRKVLEPASELSRPARIAATIEEFWSLPESTLSVEYINGEIIMAPSPTPAHQTISRNIFSVLHGFAQSTGAGGFLFSPLDVTLPTGDVVQPDILFLTNKELKRALKDKRLHIVPSFLVEILSPGSIAHDTLTKRELYERSGVREYWIVDPEAKTLAQLVLRKKRYALMELAEADTIKSVVLKGFEMNVGRLLGL